MTLFKKPIGKAALSSCLLVMMVLSFAVKAAIPAGFMPSVSKDGFIELVICSGMGEKTVLVPADQSTPPDHSADDTTDICEFQILSAHKIFTAPSTPVLVVPDSVVVESSAVAQISFYQISQTSFSARGPPALV